VKKMFDATKCDFCGECLERCLYLDFDREGGADAFETLYRRGEGDWVKKCVTCFACNEFCAKGARPFDLILAHLQRRGDFVPPKIVSLLLERFTPRDAFQAPPIDGPVLSLCTIEGNLPRKIGGALFEGMTVVKGRHFFCNVIFPHLGDERPMREGLGPLVERYASLGRDEIVFLHDDCYALMAGIAPQYGVELPFRPVHIFEHLRDRLGELRDRIRPLDMAVAYQRPCASRLTPWKEPFLDEIFRLLGVTRVKRTYDGENALCCGQDLKGLARRGDKFPAYQEENVRDAAAAGAEAMVFLCPMCLDAIGGRCQEAGLKTYMITDLCRLALGEG